MRTVIQDVTGALAHLHVNQVVHAGIKPANILVGPGERGKLADFDISVESGECPPACTTIKSLHAAGGRFGLAHTDQNSAALA